MNPNGDEQQNRLQVKSPLITNGSGSGTTQFFGPDNDNDHLQLLSTNVMTNGVDNDRAASSVKTAHSGDNGGDRDVVNVDDDEVINQQSSSTSSAAFITPEESCAPNGGYGWIVVFASFMCNLTVDGICYTFGLFLPYFMAEFGSNKAITAFAGSLCSGCYMFAGAIVSSLENRFGCRPVAIFGSLAAASSLVAATYVPNVYLLILTYGFTTGTFFSFIYLPSIVSVGHYFTTKRAFATAIAVCGSGAGAFLFAPFVSALLATFDWQWSLRILAGLAALCSFYGMLMKPLGGGNGGRGGDKSTMGNNNSAKQITDNDGELVKRMEKHLKNNDHEMMKETKSSESRKTLAKTGGGSGIRFFLSQFHNPAITLLSIANIFGMSGYYIPYVYITGYAENQIRMSNNEPCSQNEAAMLLSAIGISNVIGRLIFGLTSDKFANGKRTIRLLGGGEGVGGGGGGGGVKVTALLINNCCLMVAALTTMAIPICGNYWILLADCILFGLFISSYMSLTSIILIDLFGLAMSSTTFGIIIFFRGISSIAGPPLAGLLYELTESYTGMFVAAGILLMISSIIHCIVHRYEE